MPPTTPPRRERSARCSWSFRAPCCPTAASRASRPGTRRTLAAAPRRLQAACSTPTCCGPPEPPNQYTVVYDSGELTVPPLADPAVSEVATFPVAPAVAVQAGDVLGFYGQGIPVDTGVTVNPDILSYPAPRTRHWRRTWRLPREARSPWALIPASRCTRRTAPTRSRPWSPRPSPIPARAHRRRPPSTRRRAASPPSPSPARAPATSLPRTCRSPPRA